MSPRIALIVGVLAFLGCKSDSSKLVDSAGATGVEGIARYRLPSAPMLTIGSDSSNHLFDNPRDPFRLASGKIIVTDGGQQAIIKQFDSLGNALTNLGGTGDGPGEYRSPEVLGRFSGDSIAVYDGIHARITIYTAEGKVARTLRWDSRETPVPAGSQSTGPSISRPGSSTPIDILSDGRLVVMTTFPLPDPQSPGIHHVSDSVVISVKSLYDAKESLVGRFFFADKLIQVTSDMAGSVSPLFRRTTTFSVLDTLLVIADNSTNSIAVYSPSGQRVREIEHPHRGMALTEDEVRLELDSRLAPFKDNRLVYDAMSKMLRHDRSDTKPAFERVLISSRGELWVGAFRAQTDSSSTTEYHIFGRDGRIIGTMRVPRAFLPTFIDAGGILGVWKDVDGVGQVRSYSIVVE